jgi:hypothetical protein
MKKMMMLNRIDKDKGLERVFIRKDDVKRVSRLKIGGRTGNTSITYKNKKGKIVTISVFEDPAYIMNKIAY